MSYALLGMSSSGNELPARASGDVGRLGTAMPEEGLEPPTRGL